MTKYHLDWTDGRFYVTPITEEEAASRTHVINLPEPMDLMFNQHSYMDAVWQRLFREMSNAMGVEARAKELLPLEDARSEIETLKYERDQARRMWDFYEESLAREQGHSWHTPENRRFNDYACIYPQPGCDLSLLSEPAWPEEWFKRASEILSKWKPQWAVEGIRYQGCCCGHEHRKLDPATTERFVAAGFLVEHATEVEADS